MINLLFLLLSFFQLHGFSNGGLDTSFNPNGAFPGLPGVETVLPLADYSSPLLTATIAFAESVVIDANGKIVAAGQSDADPNGPSMTLMRLNDNGSLDTTLNPAGAFLGVRGIETIWTASFGTGTVTAKANGIALLSDGRIALGGEAVNTPASPAGNGAFAAVLLHGSNGSLDTSFNPSPANVFPGVPGVESVWTVSFGTGATNAFANAIAIQANNMLVLAGEADPPAAGGGFHLQLHG